MPAAKRLVGGLELLAGLGQDRQALLHALGVDDVPADVIHRNRVGGEEQPAVRPDAAARAGGAALPDADQAVNDVEHELFADDLLARRGGNEHVILVVAHIFRALAAAYVASGDVVVQSVGQV